MTAAEARRHPRGPAVVRAVLEATLDELCERGYGALTFEEVARRAGVNKTTVYRRWPSRPALVKAALTAVADAMPGVVETGDVRADLRAVARRTRDAMSAPRGRGVLRMMIGGCLEPDLVTTAIALRKAVEAPARRLLERAVERGALRPGTDASVLLDAVSGWIVHVLFRERGAVTDERLDAFVDLLLGGALPRGETARPRLVVERSRARARAPRRLAPSGR